MPPAVSPATVPHGRAVLRSGFALLACLTACSGCADLFRDDVLDVDPDPARLRAVDPVDLSDFARQPPRTVEEVEADLADVGAEDVADVRAASPLAVPVPASVDVALDEVRAAALAGNLELEVRLIDPVIAATAIDEEEARFESLFSASARTSSSDQPVALGTEGSQVDVDALAVGVDVPLRTGGTISIDAPLTETETNNPFALLNPSVDAGLTFSISQPLLRNAGVRANTHAIRVARGRTRIAEAETRLEAIRILAEADRAYWRLYGARRALEVREQEYELALEQLRSARRRVEAGDAAEIEVLRADAGAAERLESIIIAETALRRRERDLRRIMQRPDLPVDAEIEVVPATEPDPVLLDLDAQRLVDVALEQRMEMLRLELEIAIDRSTIDLERNRALPLVVLDYAYGFNGLGGNRGNAIDDVFGGDFADWSLGVRAEIPIGNEAAKARVSRAVLTRLQRLATREQRRSAIDQEVRDAADQVRSDWQRILAARRNAVLAGRTLEAERRQFDVGASTSTDVLDASARLADARLREILALVDYEVSRIDLAFATGTLLGSGRVRWTPGAPERVPERTIAR